MHSFKAFVNCDSIRSVTCYVEDLEDGSMRFNTCLVRMFALVLRS